MEKKLEISVLKDQKRLETYAKAEQLSSDELVISREIARLTLDQRRIIKESMQYLKQDELRNGWAIFVRFLSQHPELKKIWPQFRPVADSSLISSDVVKAHALTYMKGLNHIIDNMDDEIRLSIAIRKISQSHAKWQISKKNVMDMVPELIVVLKSGTQIIDEATEDAWCTLYAIIGNLIEYFKRKY